MYLFTVIVFISNLIFALVRSFMWRLQLFSSVHLQVAEGEGRRAGRHRLQEGAIWQTAGRPSYYWDNLLSRLPTYRQDQLLFYLSIYLWTFWQSKGWMWHFKEYRSTPKKRPNLSYMQHFWTGQNRTYMSACGGIIKDIETFGENYTSHEIAALSRVVYIGKGQSESWQLCSSTQIVGLHFCTPPLPNNWSSCFQYQKTQYHWHFSVPFFVALI